MPIMTIVWLGIFISTLVIEISAPGLVSIWFSAGSLVSLLLSLILGDKLIWLQVIVFIVVSVLFIVFIRPYIKRMNEKKAAKVNVDSLVGQTGLVVKRIPRFETGEVKMVNSVIWSAYLADDVTEDIEEGKRVEVVQIKGNKLFVKEYKEV